MAQLTLITAYLMLTVVIVSLFWSYRHASPIFWFPVSLALMAIGTFMLTDLSDRADATYVALYFVALVSFCVTSLSTAAMSRLDVSYRAYLARSKTPDTPEVQHLFVAVLAISAVVTTFYYTLIGYNLLLSILFGEVEDYTAQRLATYSSAEYFAPGYVNQFKNALLPVTATTIAFWLRWSGRSGYFWTYVAIVAPLTTVALLGTGQRAYVLYTAFSIVFGLLLYRLGEQWFRPWRMVVYLSPVILMFAVMTTPRLARGTAETSLSDTILEILKRVTTYQQEGGLAGFRYTFNMKTAWFSEWWEQLRGLAPSQQGSLLAHEVHEILYGTARGTVPMSPIGSAYYNGGLLGVVALYAVLGVGYTVLYRRFLNGQKTLARSMVYGFLFFYLSVYVVDAPISLIQNGAISFLLLLLLMKIQVLQASRGTPQPGRVNVAADALRGS